MNLFTNTRKSTFNDGGSSFSLNLEPDYRIAQRVHLYPDPQIRWFIFKLYSQITSQRNTWQYFT